MSEHEAMLTAIVTVCNAVVVITAVWAMYRK
jgi:hypothetical protein